MPRPAPHWGHFLIWPPCLEKGGAGREHSTIHLENDTTDIFLSRWERGRWRFTIGGARLLPEQMDQWDAFVDALGGLAYPFLFWMNSRRFKMARQSIGTGDGSRTVFQLAKTRAYPFGPVTAVVEKIVFPWHDYPALTYPNGAVALPTEWVQVWVNGVLKSWQDGDFEVEREGGAITFPSAIPNGHVVEASCRYLVLVHGPDFLPMEAEGSAGVYEFPGGAELFESLGEADDIPALLAELAAAGVPWAGG